MTVMVGEQLVHSLNCYFPPDKDSIDWWGWLDMSEYIGKTARVSAATTPEIAALIDSGDQIRHLQPHYDEALRPQFHISQTRGWNNDPNGMFYHDGSYHFFWQSNPAGFPWQNMYWGYATSPDMVHWTEHPHALRPFGGQVANRHPSMAVKECFSGSGNVDHHNTAGWQTGKDKTLVLAFTDTGCGECLAYSNDRGKTWKYYAGNPARNGSSSPPTRATRSAISTGRISSRSTKASTRSIGVPTMPPSASAIRPTAASSRSAGRASTCPACRSTRPFPCPPT